MAKERMIYEIAAEQAIDLMKQGKMPMFESGRQPVGAMTGEAYQGINATLLSMSGHTDPRWITREQADRNNLFVKKGEKSTRILKQSWTKNVAKINPESGFPERDTRGNVVTQTVRLQNPVMRLVPAFNASQMQDVPPLGRSAPEYDPLQRAEEVLKNSGITIKHDQKERDHYNPRLHEIHMMPEDHYREKEDYLEAGLYRLTQAMAQEDGIRTKDVGDADKTVRDQMAVARAHAVLCSNIGIEADINRQLEHTQEYIETLENSPYTIMEASKLASEITSLVQDREKKRNPELASELAAEKHAMAYASPKAEIENHRSMQRVLNEHQNNPDNVFTFQHEGKELYARKGSEKLYSKPGETPGLNDVFDMKHQVTAFSRAGDMFNVVMTNTFVQLADGESEQIDNNRRPQITDLDRSAMFPPDWTGRLVVEPAYTKENDDLVYGGVPPEEAELYCVCAEREDMTYPLVKSFDSRSQAEDFAAIYENEYGRQTGKYPEKSLEGVTFFDVKFDPAEKKVAENLGLEYFGQVRSWGAPPEVDLDVIRARFDEHDPYQRMAEVEARKAERAAGIGVTVIDVPKGREDEALFLGAAHSRKHDHFYIPDNVNPEPLLERFEQTPAVITQEAQAKESYTVPYPEREEAAKAGIVYNDESRGYEATSEVSQEALERWGADSHGQEQPLLTPAQEVAQVLESLDLDIDGQEPQLTGEAVAIDVRDDIPNQKNGMYVAYQDGSCYAKNNLTQEEVYHPAKGYVLTNQMREEMRENARELLSNYQKADEAKMNKAADKIRSDIEKLPVATEQTPYMRDNGIEPMEGIHAKGKNTVIPLVNSGGEIRSSMTIKPDGATVAAPRGQTVGVFGAMGGYEKLRTSPAIIVTVEPKEGATIGKATDLGIAAAGHENNVRAVVNGLKAEMPNKPVFIVASDMLDKTVREVTEKTNAAVLTPTFAQGERDQGLSTFHDMAMSSKLGLEGVKKQVMASVEKEVAKARDLNNKEQAQEKKAGRSQELSRA